METQILKKIQEKGLKKAFLAKKLGISAPYFSMLMSGERTLSDEKRKKLIEMLNN